MLLGTCSHVYKSKNGNFYKTWAGGLEGPIGAVYTANKSGYYTLDKFSQWLDEVGEKSRTFYFDSGGEHNVGLLGIYTVKFFPIWVNYVVTVVRYI